MTGFSGSVFVRVNEATNLKPTAFIKRLPGLGTSLLDTYVEINIDDHVIGKTSTKPKVSSPVWEEEFSDQVRTYFSFNTYMYVSLRLKVLL